MNAIKKYHGGYKIVRKKLGLDNNNHENGYWTYENTLFEVKKLYDEHGSLPPESVLRKIGYSHIPEMIRKYFGGMNDLRALIAIEKKDGFEKTPLEELVEVLSSG